MSNKKRISIENIIKIVLILVVLFIVGCSINEKKLTKGTSASNILNDCKCTQYCYGEIYDTACLIDKASHPQNCIDLVETKTAKGVYGGEDVYFTEETKKACFENLISKQTSIVLCNLFPDEFKYKCFAGVGKKNLEPDHCKELPYSYKSDCYLYISKNKTDFSLALCDELNYDNRVSCYSNRATINDDSSTCLKLEEGADKINCYSQIDEKFELKFERQHYVPIYYDWFKKAKLDKNLINESYCIFENTSLIIDDSRRNDTCYISLAMYHGNLLECYKLPENYLGVNLIRKCFFYTALWNNLELEECDNLGIDFKECREGVILSKKNPDLCYEFYKEYEQQGWCILKMAADYYGAYGQKNILLCGKIGGFMLDKCIQEYNYNENDESSQKREVCKILVDSTNYKIQGYKCYYNVAIKNLDISLCEELEEGNLKNDCKERIQNANKNP